jgi:hypothetical protein
MFDAKNNLLVVLSGGDSTTLTPRLIVSDMKIIDRGVSTVVRVAFPKAIPAIIISISQQILTCSREVPRSIRFG